MNRWDNFTQKVNQKLKDGVFWVERSETQNTPLLPSTVL